MSVVLDRPPKTDEELWYLVQALWGHKIPRTSVCTGHDAPFDAFATAYFNREPQILIRGTATCPEQIHTAPEGDLGRLWDRDRELAKQAAKAAKA